MQSRKNKDIPTPIALKDGGIVSKRNYPPINRNPSITSSSLNTAVRITRLPSNRSERDYTLRPKSNPIQIRPTTSTSSTISSDVQLRKKPTSAITTTTTQTKLDDKKVVNSTRPKTYITNTNSGISHHFIKPKSVSNNSSETTTTTTIKSNSGVLKPKNDPNYNNNSNLILNKNLKERNKLSSEPVNKNRRPPPQNIFDSLVKTKIRGQGPSGSKNSGGILPSSNGGGGGGGERIKNSSSVSSLDGIGIIGVKSSKSSKNHGSRDKLEQNYNQNITKLGSKDHLADNKEKDTKENYKLTTKEKQQQQKYNNKEQTKQMIGIQQQQHHAGNNNLINQRDVVYPEQGGLTRDITDINFDGPREQEVRQNRMLELQTHLERMTREKMALETKVVELSSFQNEVQSLRNELSNLQTTQEKSGDELHRLSEENELLRTRLRDVVQSPLSDNEKQQIIQDSQRLHSSAPASIALPNNHDNVTPCVTPDWDKNSSCSEVSVACLQDKISQMEETHYSTNEELQATLQELADLQSQLTEIQQDNERLAEEKDVIFQSLCRQTEKLEDSRNQIGTLQELLLREPSQQEVSNSEREQKLYDLLKNAQEERENLLVKQEELNSELNELRTTIDDKNKDILRLRERISLLDSTVDAANAERKQIESHLQQAKEDSAEKYIEISRLTTLLENARSKIDEYEQDRVLGDKSDLGELLDTARKEKDLLEIQVASLQEQFSKSQCEIQKLKDQLVGITEEVKVARNNAKCALSDLEYKYEQLKQEKVKLTSDYQNLQDQTNELHVQCKCHLEDKTQLEGLLSETQRHLGETERILSEKEETLMEEKKFRQQESEEWEQFQADLLMTVRVANDFKTEAQQAHEQLAIDNKNLREKIRHLEQQIEKLNKLVASDTQQSQSLLNTMKEEISVRRQKSGISRQDSRLSVKSLIESIENATKQAKAQGGSRCSSTSSLNSLTSDIITNGQNGLGMNRKQVSEWAESVVSQNQLNTPTNGQTLNAKSPLREQQQTIGTNMNGSNQKGGLITDGKLDSGTILQHHNNNNNNSKLNNNNNNINNLNNNNNNNHYHHHHHNIHHHIGKLSKQQQSDDPCVTSILSQQQQKSMDYVRRNSYGDLSERKDPLNALVKNGGSKRNALLKWCQNKTVGYRNIDITNFSSSWNDGLALCAILHSYLNDRVPSYDTLTPNDKRKNFSIAFSAAESVGIITTLNINEMCQQERPDWQQVMAYVTAIYKHFET